MTLTPSDLEQTAVTPGDWLPGYELLSAVGVGGFGTVFKARQLKLDRLVAVKVVNLDSLADPAAAARFEAEAVALGRFCHPNIVQVFDCGRHGDRMFIAMELLDGEDLGRRLKRVGRLDEPTAWVMARQAAAGLAHAAAGGVVHRDVKPANLFLVPAPTGIDLPRGAPMVKVTDFGLALARRDGAPAAPEGIAGTPVYMAPEQCRWTGEIDHRADIYALGATVYHAISGRPPFDGMAVWDVVARKLTDTPRFLAQVSPESAELVAAMMAPDPADRIGTYEELIDRIDRMLAGRTVVLPLRARPVRKRWRWAVAAGVMAVAGAGVVVGQGVPSGWRPTTPRPAAVRYVSSGPHVDLFDGHSGWLPPASGGVWRIDTDDEKGIVFTGTGFTRRPFPRAEHYRLVIGLDIHQATAAEAHFAIPAHDPEAGDRLVLRVTRPGGAVLGVRAGDQEPFRPLGEAVPFPPPNPFKDGRPYLEVRVQQAGGEWAVWFNGKPAGRVADDGTPKAAELRLFADGGPARIDTAVFQQLEGQSTGHPGR